MSGRPATDKQSNEDVLGGTGAEKHPHDTDFKQQRLKAWQPILTPNSVILTFLGVALVFIPIGIGILVSSNSVIDAGPYRYDQDHDESASTPTVTYVSFTWPKTTKDNVYMYYQLSNFYQNHRRYVKSRSDIQLSGSSLGDVQTLGDCDPWETFADHLPNTFEQINMSSVSSLGSVRLNPCGLIANSQFNDTFQIFNTVCTSDTSCTSANNFTSEWTNRGIAWSSDRDRKFKNYEGFDGTPTTLQQADVEDEEFIVWMRTAGLPTFKKLHRIFKGGLAAGNYTLRIVQNFPVHSFDGEKAFYLTTTTWIGGKNDFLGWAYIVVGIVCVVLALAFKVKHVLDPRPLGDPATLHGSKS